MTYDESELYLRDHVVVSREEVARAKAFILKNGHETVDSIVDDWLKEQKVPKKDIVEVDAADLQAEVDAVARHFTLRLSMYHAVWELVVAGDLLPIGAPSEWTSSVTAHSARGSGSFLKKNLRSFRYTSVFRPPSISTLSTDPDVFLGFNCPTLHSGIHEAITQALSCFRRGLYMPATVMIAAAAEATWIECGSTVATKLSNVKLTQMITNGNGIGKIVATIVKSLESHGKDILKSAGQSIVGLNEAEQWTTILRDRRNALHWGKAKNFVADHSTTASLMMGAPMHLLTLESIRLAAT